MHAGAAYAALLSLLLAAAPALAETWSYTIGGIGSARVTIPGYQRDYPSVEFSFGLIGDSDDIVSVSGKPWIRELPLAVTQLYLNNGQSYPVYGQFDTPLVLYSGDGPLPFVGLARADDTHVVEITAASLSPAIDLMNVDFVGELLTPSFFGDGMGFATNEGFITLRADPATSLRFTSTVGFHIVTPEPASWAMLVTGFGLVGGGLRRRRAALARRGGRAAKGSSAV